jgi:catechol 2,3-dioxygenase-like lactoylglutathione lyase family enzyme
MPNLLDSLDHITVITNDLKKTKKFYINILGMEVDNNRPPFDFDGAWLSINKRPVVHVIVNKNHIDSKDKPTLDHIAFRVNNINMIKTNLSKFNINYKEKTTPDNKIIQIFITDPNGVKVELSKSII